MAQSRAEAISDRSAAAPAADRQPQVRSITVGDVKDALAKGRDDFMAMPKHVIYLGVIYALLGLVLVSLTFGYSLVPLVFPLVSGFALLGPVAATGLYELSRRREQGLDTSWWHMFGVLGGPSGGRIVLLGVALLLAFLVWLDVALGIYRATFGEGTLATGVFLEQIFTTRHGLILLVVGTAVGGVFALLVFAATAVSVPMLVDRKVSLSTAVGTSVRAVAANPGPMLVWGMIVVALLAVGSLPLLVGLAVTLPILGHGTWHLYRKVVES